jgi:short-subunit dehydrogenase
MPGTLTTYGASKAAVASLGNGIRADLFGSPIKVTVLYPGYIASEMNDAVGQRPPMMASTAKGVRAMVRAIDREVANTAVPQWPWKPLGIVLRYAPTSVLRRFAS